MTRTEFENNLRNIFNCIFKIDPRYRFEAIVSQDPTMLAAMQAKISQCHDKVDGYLLLYDEAPTQPEKDAVVGSVIDDVSYLTFSS